MRHVSDLIAQESPALAAEASRQLLEELRTLVVVYGFKVGGALLFIIVAWFVAGWVTVLARRALFRASFDVTLTKFIVNTLRWIVLILAGVACLGIFGIQTASFAAVIGAAGLAIGLAFQGTLSNLAAGAMLLIYRPFKVGDQVVVAGQAGIVDGLELFTTKLDTPDNRRVILPNAAVFGSVIENRTYHPERRLQLDIPVVYAAPTERVRQALLSAADALEFRLPGRPVEAEISRFASTGVEWSLKVWVPTARLEEATHRLSVGVKEQFERAGVEFPVLPHVRGAA